MEKIISGFKKKMNTKNSLIVVICILVLIIIIQNLHIFGGSSRNGFKGNYQNSSNRSSLNNRSNPTRTMGLPGMMGGGGMQDGRAGR